MACVGHCLRSGLEVFEGRRFAGRTVAAQRRFRREFWVWVCWLGRGRSGRVAREGWWVEFESGFARGVLCGFGAWWRGSLLLLLQGIIA